MKNRSLKIYQKNVLKPSKITVIGAGSWGFSISELLAKNSHLVTILGHSKDSVQKISKKYVNSTFSINSSSDPKSIHKSEFIFIVVPSDAVLSVLKSVEKEKISTKITIVICSKGIESNSLQLFSDCVKKELPNNSCVILSGPNFASEVSASFPTTTTIASKSIKYANKVANLLKNNHFSPIVSNDIVSAQIFGAIKNILAIGCGVIDGLELGENAKAALVLKGIIESNLLIKKLGGNPQKSFVSPCGLGDLFLTCSSKKSRNNFLGFMIGSGKKIKDILSSGTTFEGFSASSSMIKLAKKNQITLPLYEKINQILHSDYSAKEIRNILSRAIIY